LYTAPTALRTFMRLGDEHVEKHDLSSLRLLGSVGEPINPEVWMWYRRKIGADKCPIVDTWWQTETGCMMIAPIPSVTTTVPGSATRALPGIEMAVLREDGTNCDPNESGLLVAKSPWPSLARGIWGDNKRFVETYWSRFKGCYFTGDGARIDEDGNFWIVGRVDDVIKVSGHRIGTAEIESSLVAHPDIAEAAVVARPDEITGQAIVAFVTPKEHVKSLDGLEGILKQRVAGEIGSFARPAEIRIAKSLPKTRSGKIMRRLLREIAEKGKASGDLSTLEDLNALKDLEK
jgi:acetyl-CoA synthetase